jgi:hypothetical protein
MYFNVGLLILLFAYQELVNISNAEFCCRLKLPRMRYYPAIVGYEQNKARKVKYGTQATRM